MSNTDKEQIVGTIYDSHGIHIVPRRERRGCIIGPEYRYIKKTERIEELIQTKKELEKQLRATNDELKKLIIAEQNKPKSDNRETKSIYESLFSFTKAKDKLLKYYYDWKGIIIEDNGNELVIAK